jgi:hypothetical protein
LVGEREPFHSPFLLVQSYIGRLNKLAYHGRKAFLPLLE